MKKGIVLLLSVCAVFFFANSASAQMYTFYSALDPANETPPLDTSMRGLAVAVVTTHDDGTSTALVVMSAFDNDTPITASHIHIGDAGVAGPVRCPLTGADFVNPVIRTCELDVELTTALFNGGLYVNVHTQAHGGGEIRDQMNIIQ